MDIKQKRQAILYKDSIDKIISDGIRPNLLKLEKSVKIIQSNHAKQQLITKELIISQRIIKQLNTNTIELEKCLNLLNEIKYHDEYNRKVESIKNQISKVINNFTKVSKQQKSLDDIPSKYFDNNLDNQQQKQLMVLKNEQQKLLEANTKLTNVQELNEDIQDLHEMMSKFGEIVHEQQPTIDRIEQNIDTTLENVHEGTKSLAIAATSSILPITCAAIGATIFGPIGGLISFKLSTGIVSAIGGSVASYSLASYVKKKRSENNIEMESMINENATKHSK